MTKLRLAHLPTPLWRSRALDALLGMEVWIKRDDMTSGAAAGNKLRKLEYLLADAQARDATVVLTCGGLQSNHARATAIVARELGMRSLLFLRTGAGQSPALATGNVLLDRMVDAEIRFVTPEQYERRAQLMADEASQLARRGERPYVIPEGGSNGRGALGYADAMREVREQLERGQGGGPGGFDAVVHACGSGGTAAGCVLGARAFEVAPLVHAVAVCDHVPSFETEIRRIVEEARALGVKPGPLAELKVHDSWKGPSYGVMDEAQRSFMLAVARRSGLVLDPVYTGKALFGLARLAPKPRRVLFLHTGGLPGLLAEPEAVGVSWSCADRRSHATFP